jgi:membrane fusion protein, multidrug efflux system
LNFESTVIVPMSSSVQMNEQKPDASLPPVHRPSASVPPEEPTGSGWRKWIVVLVIALVVAAAIWKIRSNSQELQATAAQMEAMGDVPTPVQVAAVQRKTMPIYLTELGTVTAYNTVTIKTRVDGQLMRVNVREGQAVKQGELLVEIDPKPYQAALEQAEGQLVKDEANAQNAKAEAARYTALQEAGVVSKESQQAQISTAGQAEGSLAADRAAIEAAKVNLGYTKIVSPIDGVVGLRQVDAGNIVHAADTTGLIVVTQLQPISVIFTLPEDQLPEVLKLTRGGSRLAVEAYDRSQATHLASGSVLTIDNQIDTTTGMVKVKAVFDNRDRSLFPNQFVNVQLILQEKQDALVIAAAALQTGSQGNFVYLLKHGRPPVDPIAAKNSAEASGGTGQDKAAYYVEARPVKVELTEGTQVILSAGVEQVDMVVVDGQEKLKNGSAVVPRQATSGTTAELKAEDDAVGQPS